MSAVTVITFDADDTLWVNEPYFREIESRFCELLAEYMPPEKISAELFSVEMANLEIYGYGVKAFMLSLTETALRITNDNIDPHLLHTIINLGKELLNKPIELLPGIPEVLKALAGKYKLVIATKGDLLDQERKAARSGINHFFHHIEIMSEKRRDDYIRLLERLNVAPENFMMIGNSFKSDILPVLELGGYAAYIPYHTTWMHEKTDDTVTHPRLYRLSSINDILRYV